MSDRFLSDVNWADVVPCGGPGGGPVRCRPARPFWAEVGAGRLGLVRPLVMGIVNVTPDSFSDGGCWPDPDAAIAHARELVAHGADVIDVGGESTRPGADPVDPATELARVLPVVEALATEVVVSIDTTKADVARAACAAGARMVNDVSASLAEVAAECGAEWIAMHRQGTPTTMQTAPTYADVVDEVAAALAAYGEAGDRAGVSRTWVDPGIGFGKTSAHNLALIAALPRLVESGRPVLVGVSRKRFLGEILGRSDGAGESNPSTDRLEGSLAAAVWAMASGCHMVRVHDVRETVQAVKVMGERPGGRGTAVSWATQVVAS